jgi:hypothetical protein
MKRKANISGIFVLQWSNIGTFFGEHPSALGSNIGTGMPGAWRNGLIFKRKIEVPGSCRSGHLSLIVRIGCGTTVHFHESFILSKYESTNSNVLIFSLLSRKRITWAYSMEHLQGNGQVPVWVWATMMQACDNKNVLGRIPCQQQSIWCGHILFQVSSLY